MDYESNNKVLKKLAKKLAKEMFHEEMSRVELSSTKVYVGGIEYLVKLIIKEN